MKRPLFSILSALSLLLFLAVVVMWARPAGTIRFIVLDGFSGPFIVIEDAGAPEPRVSWGTLTLHVPPSRVLRVPSTEPFVGWHRAEARYESGGHVPFDYGVGEVRPDQTALISSGREVRWHLEALKYWVGTAAEVTDERYMELMRSAAPRPIRP